MRTGAPEMEVKTRDNFALADFLLRFLLFVLALVGVLVMVTSKQTISVSIPTTPPYLVYVPAKFNQLPALTYFVATLSVVSLYGIITTLVSLCALLNPAKFSQMLSHFVMFDLVSLVFMGSATGAASSVGYIGWKGNSHTGWREVCNVYGKFCKSTVASIVVSLFGSMVLVLIILLSFLSLSKKISKQR